MIVVSPFANSDIREWPLAAYGALIALLVERLPAEAVTVIGTRSQASRGCELVRPFAPDRVRSGCGRMAWPAVAAMVRDATCVIGNNSGVAHLAAGQGVATVCIFGGSHQRIEWRPRGSRVALVSRAIGCSPCNLNRAALCPYAKACLREIEPMQVADAVLDLLDGRLEHAA